MTYPDGFYITYGYDTLDLTAEFENGSTQIFGFTYDGLGRRLTLTRGNGVTTTYSYDGASELSTVTHALTQSSYNNSISFSYNPAGQITSRASAATTYAEPDSPGVSNIYGSANGQNQYSTAPPFTPSYGDARGNLTSDGTRTYGYDSDNRLTSASGSVTLTYDPASRLASVTGTAGTTRFLYDGNEVIAEYDGSATPVLLRRYVHGPRVDEPLVWYEGAGTTNRSWLLADERGSVIAVTDGTGTVTQVNKYDVDGVPDPENAGRFQFTGQMWIPEAGVYYFKARVYHAGLGRFMQPDPSGYASGLNLYVYAGDDPINGTDPTGLDDTGLDSQTDALQENGIRKETFLNEILHALDEYLAPYQTGEFFSLDPSLKPQLTSDEEAPPISPSLESAFNRGLGSLADFGDLQSRAPSGLQGPADYPGNFVYAAGTIVGASSLAGAGYGFSYAFGHMAAGIAEGLELGTAEGMVVAASAVGDLSGMAMAGSLVGGAGGMVLLIPFGAGYAMGTAIYPWVDSHLIAPLYGY